MKGLLYLICFILGMMAANDYIIHDKIDSIRQDIGEIKKDFSYDPKDAK